MAYNKEITNYYSSLVADAYASNISAQITRIEDAHNVIRSKAIELGLYIPANTKLTHAGTTDLLLAATHHILDTAAAINNIPINKDTNKSLNAGASYTVPVGYNAVPYTITANTLSSQTSGTAAAADILSGKTAWVNGSKLTGTMANLAGNQAASEFGSYTKDSAAYLQIEIPATGKYTVGSYLQSDIRYITPTEVEVPVTIRKAETGETIVDTSKFQFAAGYYSGPFNVKAVLDTESDNKVINIANTVGATLSAKSGTLTIPTGYDYLAPNASYTVKSGSVSAVTRHADPETGVVTFAGGTTTAGWVSSNVTLPATYTPPAAAYEINPVTGLATVTTAGWVTKDSTVGGLAPGSATLSGPTKATAATTIGGTSISANQYYVKLTKTAGYISAGESAINLGLASMSSATSSATSGGTKITTKRWKVTTSQGYNPSAKTTELYVQDSVLNPAVTIGEDYACTLNITQSGWIDKKTVTLNINAADQTYQLGNDDLDNADGSGYEVVVQAAEGTLMKSISIDTSVLYSRLSQI